MSTINNISTRTSTFSQFRLALFNINNIQNRLNKIQEQLSTGSKINRLSDEPQNISKFFNLKATLSKINNDLQAVKPLKTLYGDVEAQFESGYNHIVRAIDIGQTASTPFLSAQDRMGLADEVQQIIDRILTLSNFSNNGKSILTGKSSPVYSKAADLINYQFSGEKSPETIFKENGIILPDEQKIFGGFSDDYKGEKDLNPDITIDTKLSLLNFGRGVELSKLIINDGMNSYIVNLEKAEKISDVITRINNIAPGIITATLNPTNDGLSVSSTTGSITIMSDFNSKSAEDLGIAGTSGSGTINGTPLNPILSGDTPISLLNGGAGIDLSGFIIENKTPNATFSATISISPTDTLQDLINKINSSGTYTRAFISEDGRRFNIVSTLQGGRLTLKENGTGTTLLDLGIFTDLAHTKLENILGGLGLGKEEQSNDIKITRRDGISFEVNFAGAVTIQDFLDRINLHPDNIDTDPDPLIDTRVIATITGNQITLTDGSSGTNTFSIFDLNTNKIAQKLQISGNFSTGSVTSIDLNPVGSKPKGLFSALFELKEGLLTDNIDLINHAIKNLQQSRTNFQSGQLQIANITNRLELIDTTFTQLKETFTTALSESVDVNLAQIIIEFQKETILLQSALATSARVLNLSLFDFLL